MIELHRILKSHSYIGVGKRLHQVFELKIHPEYMETKAVRTLYDISVVHTPFNGSEKHYLVLARHWREAVSVVKTMYPEDADKKGYAFRPAKAQIHALVKEEKQ